MQPIVIIAATPRELALLASQTDMERGLDNAPFAVHEGTFAGQRVVLAVSGIGKANAAACTSFLLERYAPRLLVSTGCAGAYPGCGIAVGDLAVAASEVYGDEGVLTPAGWEPLQTIGIPAVERGGRRYFNEFPLSLAAAAKAVHLAGTLGLALHRGRFVTVSTCSGTTARGVELKHRFDAICENMEGAALAQVALLYGVDCLEVRGVSNLVEDRDLSRWDLPLAVDEVQRFLRKFIETL
ncbi:MAG TPA: futalosine hydrolase [Geobacteraceae bacterium]